MANAGENRKIFCITDGTVRTLTREMDLPKEKLTPELIERIKDAICIEFRDWDSWLKEVIDQLIGEGE
jgi:hypothetical protein